MAIEVLPVPPFSDETVINILRLLNVATFQSCKFSI